MPVESGNSRTKMESTVTAADDITSYMVFLKLKNMRLVSAHTPMAIIGPTKLSMAAATQNAIQGMSVSIKEVPFPFDAVWVWLLFALFPLEPKYSSQCSIRSKSPCTR